MASLVLPAVCADGTTAALKLQPLDEENAGEPIGLRAWDGDGAVRLLDQDPATGAMLLERLNATRPLSALPDGPALQILAELPPRLVAVPAPHGLRGLAEMPQPCSTRCLAPYPCCATGPSNDWCRAAPLPSPS
jgi:streptomycin 6-kinase